MMVADAWIVAGLLVSTWAAAQLWFAQLVVYPLFAQVGDAQYAAYHRFYARRIPLPVIVPGFACFLLPMPVAWFAQGDVLALVNIACGFIGLLVTVVLEIPRHSILERRGRDARVIAELVRYNWPRTLAVTAQAALCLAMLIGDDHLSNASELRVFSGRVRLNVQDGSGLVLPARQWALVDGAAIRTGAFDPAAHGDWQNDWLEADSIRLGFAVERLARYSATPLRLDDPKLADMTFSGRFRLDTPEQSLELIGALFGLQVNRRGRAIYLERAGREEP